MSFTLSQILDDLLQPTLYLVVLVHSDTSLKPSIEFYKTMQEEWNPSPSSELGGCTPHSTQCRTSHNHPRPCAASSLACQSHTKCLSDYRPKYRTLWRCGSASLYNLTSNVFYMCLLTTQKQIYVYFCRLKYSRHWSAHSSAICIAL